jgi:hypothetical protein
LTAVEVHRFTQPPKATTAICAVAADRDICLAQGKFEPPFTSFDHLVGAGEQSGIRRFLIGDAAAPPSSVMNARRFIFAVIRSPRQRAR